MALRWGWTPKPWTKANIKANLVLKPDRLGQPHKWKDGRRIFVNSMSDLFLEEIPDDFRAQVFDVMCATPRHTYQILTKRPEVAARFVPEYLATLNKTHGRKDATLPAHIWIGVSVENQKCLDRMDILRSVPAALRFISFEPLLEDLGPVDLSGYRWAIVGGESGDGYRPMDHAWARSLRDQSKAQGVAFFFKQSAAQFTERGTKLIEADGSKTLIQEYPTTPPQAPEAIPGAPTKPTGKSKKALGPASNLTLF
jgi:protein gp37